MSLGSDLVAAAARNNAAWCDAVARAHGAPGALAANLWLNRNPAPRFYPNLVTLGGPEKSTHHLAAIRALAKTPPAPGWAVKDSFAALDLAPLGFGLLLEAGWIHRTPRLPDELARRGIAHRVTSAATLAAWEDAWRGPDGPPDARQFPDALLAEPDHAILALERDGMTVAGCIASRSDGVIGISNLFTQTDYGGCDRAACLAAAMQFAPDLPLVGYERGADRARMIALGFSEIGRLRVWQARA